MEELRRLRQEAGLSQAQLARESGVDRATINKIEQGKRSPSMGTLESLARAMKAEVGDFFPKAQAPLLPPDPGSEIGAYLGKSIYLLADYLGGEDPKRVITRFAWESVRLAEQQGRPEGEIRELRELARKATAESDPNSRYWPLERKRLEEGLESLQEAPKEARKA